MQNWQVEGDEINEDGQLNIKFCQQYKLILVVYVDLTKNPESYTGYQGKNIWPIIYKENCFNNNIGGFLTEQKQLCKEQQLFNRVISGLHASISSHICEYYIPEGKKEYEPSWKFYFDKVGNYQDRLENLYFTYSLVLRFLIKCYEHVSRAINIAASSINDYDIETGHPEEDAKTKQLLIDILNVTQTHCYHPIREEDYIFHGIEEKVEFVQLLIQCIEQKAISNQINYGLH